MITIKQQNHAIQKIKNHIKKHGYKEVEVTPTMARYWWNWLNKSLFFGILRPPNKFHCRNFHRDSEGYIWHGWCQSYEGSLDVEIGIRRTPRDKEQFFSILAHEMTHQFQRMIGEKMGHNGKYFLMWEKYSEDILDIPLDV